MGSVLGRSASILPLSHQRSAWASPGLRLNVAVALSGPERVLRAKVAAHSRWARTIDRSGATATMRRGFDARFEAEVDRLDPEHRLPDETRAKLLQSTRTAYFTRLAFKRVKAASKKKARELPVSRAEGEGAGTAVPPPPP
jgi:hypothetical protein